MSEYSKLVAEKDEVEKRQFESDLKATRLGAELTSSRKALRQAVAQLQQLEVTQFGFWGSVWSFNFCIPMDSFLIFSAFLSFKN